MQQAPMQKPPNQQFMPQQQQQQQQQPPAVTNNADEELYNRKIEELQQHLPRLERMLANATGRSIFKCELKMIVKTKKSQFA